ncbi:radical SAM protein [Xenorhabdus nematophila]|uniref:coproporphyrinogen-III oxidase family protein n=1 Tax=Xenorhabdus nematophila TaxID=628 RepID=UPI000543D584|nr:radical SAM protein [Xenorhabdus nematophila]KHD27646.1 coproporphyrinogen III oxidase [Xenorhabdus nematophila]MBA0018493.1 radical SAM protein [Xenorhabdus nematophila]CEF30932.1 Coproporphyrinogen III oxidase [Xenorhabdus nematophila str. Websteri]
MKLINNGIIKFDYQFPIYNFFFPNQIFNSFSGDEDSISRILGNANSRVRSRALYFHIPFCESICTFCPFTKGLYKNHEVIDRYVKALINEVEYKSRFIDYKEIPIRAIFFGGGTPSLLSPQNIIDIGETIKKYFDLSSLQEFSFELSINSVTRDRVEALKEIGVTHTRFGLQTMEPTWRKLFNLTASVDTIEQSSHLLVSNFDYVLCDIIYGMHGQDEDVIISDLDKAIALGLSNIDIYPINNVVTSSKLHKSVRDYTDNITSATRKFSMKLLIDLHMRSKGFMPHNGHGYVRADVTDQVVTDDYSFIYHEHIYGYGDHDFLGFGINAISSLRGHVITNTTGREKYIDSMNKNIYLCKISQHDELLDEMKPLILRLPYHGHVDKSQVKMNLVPERLYGRLGELVEAGLIADDAHSFRLTKLGWYWYSNIMFYLMPEAEQAILKKIVHEELKTPGKFLSKKEIIYTSNSQA